jgi:molybdopterin-guanine dinucleotide biosynthesis protein A/rhodanese-related sulfurtransferase
MPSGGLPAFDAVVLCGGESRRMGQDKALLEIDGVPMARRVVDALRAAGATAVTIQGGDAVALAALGLEVVPDRYPQEGPFPAVVQAVEAPGAPIVVVCGCDLLHPSVDAIQAIVGALAEHPDAVAAIPVADGREQWVHGAWRRNRAAELRAALDAGHRSLHRAAVGLDIVLVPGVPSEHLQDADRPRDLPAGARPGVVGHSGSLPAMDVPEIDIATLATLREQGVPLIDVREDHEYLDAHVPGARHIPLGEVADRAGEVPMDGTVYVICAAGVRSARAVEHYRSLGLDAVNVAGGTKAWIDAGLPTDGGPGGGTTAS